MDNFSNKKWTQISNLEFTTEASDLGIPPGKHPETVHVVDPWHSYVADDTEWREQRRGGDVTGWIATVLNTHNKWVTLVILND